MSKKVISVKRSTTLHQLLKLFDRFHIFPLVPVVEEDGKLIGIVSFKNLINVFSPRHTEIVKNIPFVDEEDEDIFNVELTKEMGSLILVADIMETHFVAIKEDESLEKAFGVMKLYLKEEIPVVDNKGVLVGMIGVFDIVRQLFSQKGII
ncbi:MAG: CBS domain-containing protein [Candidatus Omnitrophica bacterium]|nr:CBS domain-containing protein [Candidatus Omnitrophota bacterium]